MKTGIETRTATLENELKALKEKIETFTVSAIKDILKVFLDSMAPSTPPESTKISHQSASLRAFLNDQFKSPKRRIEHKDLVPPPLGRPPKYTTSLLKSLRTKKAQR